MLKHTLLSIATVWACVAAPSAMADTQVTATFGSLTYTLVDLDPYDGITPSLMFEPFPGAFASASTALQYDGLAVPHTYTATGTDTLSVTEDPVPDLWLTGTLDGRAAPGTQQISLAGLARSGEYNQGQINMKSGQIGFVLSPQTSVRFEMVIDFEGSVTADDSRYEYFTAYFDMTSGWASQTGGSGHRLTVFGDNGGVRYPVQDFTYMLWNEELNTSSAPRQGRLAFEADILVLSQTVSPVPEPGTLPMFAAGMVVVGAWARRRRR